MVSHVCDTKINMHKSLICGSKACDRPIYIYTSTSDADSSDADHVQILSDIHVHTIGLVISYECEYFLPSKN